MFEGGQSPSYSWPLSVCSDDSFRRFDMPVRIGDPAQTVTRLSPSGMIAVNGQRHSARSLNVIIDAGREVVIVSGDLHGFVVQPASETADLESLPNFGRPVHSSFGDSVRAEHARTLDADQEWQIERQKWRVRVGPRVGLLFAVIGIAVAWTDLARLSSSSEVAGCVLGALALGGVLGRALLRLVDRSLEDIDSQLQRFALSTTCLALLGGSLAAAWSIPRYGVGLGAFLSLVAMFVAGFPLPALMAIASASADAAPMDGVEIQVSEAPPDGANEKTRQTN